MRPRDQERTTDTKGEEESKLCLEAASHRLPRELYGDQREKWRLQSQLHICAEGKIGESTQTCCTSSSGLIIDSSGGKGSLMQSPVCFTFQFCPFSPRTRQGSEWWNIHGRASTSGPGGGGAVARGGLQQGRSQTAAWLAEKRPYRGEP